MKEKVKRKLDRQYRKLVNSLKRGERIRTTIEHYNQAYDIITAFRHQLRPAVRQNIKNVLVHQYQKSVPDEIESFFQDQTLSKKQLGELHWTMRKIIYVYGGRDRKPLNYMYDFLQNEFHDFSQINGIEIYKKICFFVFQCIDRFYIKNEKARTYLFIREYADRVIKLIESHSNFKKPEVAKSENNRLTKRLNRSATKKKDKAFQCLTFGDFTYRQLEEGDRFYNDVQRLSGQEKIDFLIQNGYRYEIDIKSAMPTIMHQFMQRFKEYDPADYYLSEAIGSDASVSRGKLAYDLSIPVKLAKQVMLAAHNGSELSPFAKIFTEKDYGILISDELVKSINDHIIIKNLKEEFNRKIEILRLNGLFEKYPNDSPEQLFSRLYRLEETKITFKVIEYLQSYSNKFVYMFDGFTVANQLNVKNLEQFILNQCGYKVIFEQKPIENQKNPEYHKTPEYPEKRGRKEEGNMTLLHFPLITEDKSETDQFLIELELSRRKKEEKLISNADYYRNLNDLWKRAKEIDSKNSA